MVMNPTEPYFWISGLKTNEQGKKVWYPLYCYSNGWRAKRIFNLIFDLDHLPPEIEDYEDFKLTQDEDSTIKVPKQAQPKATQPKGKKPATGKIIKKKAR